MHSESCNACALFFVFWGARKKGGNEQYSSSERAEKEKRVWQQEIVLQGSPLRRPQTPSLPLPTSPDCSVAVGAGDLHLPGLSLAPSFRLHPASQRLFALCQLRAVLQLPGRMVNG